VSGIGRGSVRFRTQIRWRGLRLRPRRSHFRKAGHLARLVLSGCLQPQRRQIMARFEFIAFGFCATFTALLTIATLSPIA
jgi:hypothetical protein